MTDGIPKNFRRNDHLANERTFLSWIRTNLGLMAFGFVVERFSFFIAQMAIFLRRPELPGAVATSSTLQVYASIFGILLVGVGALFCIIAFMHFKRTEKQINKDTYETSTMPYLVLAFFVFLVGVFLITFLMGSHR